MTSLRSAHDSSVLRSLRRRDLLRCTTCLTSPVQHLQTHVGDGQTNRPDDELGGPSAELLAVEVED